MADIRRELQPQHHRSGMLSDILFALFRRKWIIVICTLLGIAAAAAFYHLFPPTYQSQAKLLVRYVLERSAVDAIDNTNKPTQAGKTTDSVIDAEVQILTSWDLAAQVAEAIGAKRLGASSNAAAAGSILSGLEVGASKGSDVILVSYKTPNWQLAPVVLQELLSRYFTKHLEVHRSAGAFDFVSQQSDQLRARLNQTEDALKALNAKAGIISLKDTMDSLNQQSERLEDQLRAAEADLAEQQAKVKQIEQGGAAGNLNETDTTKDNAKDNATPPTHLASTKDIGDHQ